MDKDTLIPLGLVIAAILGLAFLGQGITGFASVTSEEVCYFIEDCSPPETCCKPICSSDDECDSPEVCCLFYEEEKGACHTSDMCPYITLVTQEEKMKGEILEPNESSFKSIYYLDMLMGIIILVFSIYYYKAHHHEISRKKVHG
jgi:hypothetical protein